MIVVEHADGHVAITQLQHAEMCAEIGQVWGNERVAAPSPRAEVLLAAREHERGWTRRETDPSFNPATSLPHTVMELPRDTRLELQDRGPREVAHESPHAALLCVHHHRSFYATPSLPALARPAGRRLRRHLRRSEALARSLRARVVADDEQIDHGWRLVRTWDALSHDLLYERAPCRREGVPAADGTLVGLELRPVDGTIAVDPWPFSSRDVQVPVTGRLLAAPSADAAALRDAWARAPSVTLSFRLRQAA